MWYIVRHDSSRVATLVKVRSAIRVSSSDPTRVKSNYIPVYTTILRQIERCLYVYALPLDHDFQQVTYEPLMSRMTTATAMIILTLF